eukprot:6096719-Alexandrium_andersonii.AAC.2
MRGRGRGAGARNATPGTRRAVAPGGLGRRFPLGVATSRAKVAPPPFRARRNDAIVIVGGRL